MLEGKPNPDMKKKISLGSHAYTHIGTTNTIKRRSVSAIALNESNEHGGHYFISLFTGKKMHCFK